MALIGLHLGTNGLLFACGIALTVLVTAAATVWRWFSTDSSLAGVVGLAVILIGAAAVFIKFPIGSSEGFGDEGASGYLSLAWAFVVPLSLLIVALTIRGAGSEWDDSGEDDPERDEGPSPSDSGIDWSELDEARAEWSRPCAGAPAS